VNSRPIIATAAATAAAAGTTQSYHDVAAMQCVLPALAGVELQRAC